MSLPKRNEKGEGAAPGATRDGSGSLYLSDTRWVSEPLHAERERSEGGGGGEFISVRDATRRAKMKADGRWCGGGHRDSGASVSTNRRNTLDSRQRGRETCLLMFEEEG